MNEIQLPSFQFVFHLVVFVVFGISLTNVVLTLKLFSNPPEPMVPKYLQEMTFDERLKYAFDHAPIDQYTKRPRLMISVVNEGMLDMTKNFLCSLITAGIQPHEYLLFAFDLPSWEEVKYLTPSAVYLPANLSHKAVNTQQIVQFFRFLHYRTGIALELLKMGCDVITCDTDVTFISHFEPLLGDGRAHLETQHDSKFDIYPNRTIPAPWKLNLGFHIWRSSPVAIRIVQNMLNRMINSPKSHDQSVLRKMTRSLPMHWMDELLVVNLSTLFTDIPDANLTVRHMDGLRAVNPGAVFLTNTSIPKWRDAAIAAGVRRPILVHWFHIGSYEEKVGLMKVKKLWFLDKSGKCAPQRATGRDWKWWDPTKTV